MTAFNPPTIEVAELEDGTLVGYRLTIPDFPAHTMLVWKEQDAMPGFRLGDHFAGSVYYRKACVLQPLHPKVDKP